MIQNPAARLNTRVENLEGNFHKQNVVRIRLSVFFLSRLASNVFNFFYSETLVFYFCINPVAAFREKENIFRRGKATKCGGEILIKRPESYEAR